MLKLRRKSELFVWLGWTFTLHCKASLHHYREWVARMEQLACGALRLLLLDFYFSWL
jgi:hypothetical protein